MTQQINYPEQIRGSFPSSGGGLGVVGQDEGVTLGTGTVLNFVGPNVDASISGSVIRVFVTGSVGSQITYPVSGTVIVADDGQQIGNATILNFGNGLSASVSGTYAQIDINLPAMRTDDLTPYVSGTVTTFALSTTPDPTTLRLFYNGVRQRYNTHYSISGSYVQTLFTPVSGSVLIADYNEYYSTGTTPQPYTKFYQNGRYFALSGSTNSAYIFSGTLNANMLGTDGILVGESLINVYHGTAQNQAVTLTYGGQTAVVTMNAGTNASKNGKLFVKLAGMGATNLQSILVSIELNDNSAIYVKSTIATFNVDSTANQAFSVSWSLGGSDPRIAFTHYHTNIGVYR